MSDARDQDEQTTSMIIALERGALARWAARRRLWFSRADSQTTVRLSAGTQCCTHRIAMRFVAMKKQRACCGPRRYGPARRPY
jgi:hypothetical protein